MKLKAIMYALGYGGNKSNLKRTEGARRVKQAQIMLESGRTRNSLKNLTWIQKYGCSSKQVAESVSVSKARVKELHGMYHLNFTDLENRIRGSL